MTDGAAAERATRRRLDELDRRIVELLSEDGRRSYSEMGRQLGHPTSTVKRRVEALRRREEILGFTAVLPTNVAPGDTEAVVEIFCRGNVATATLTELFIQVPEVVLAVAVAGAADAVVILRAEDNDALGRTIETIRESKLIERTRTSIVLKRL